MTEVGRWVWRAVLCGVLVTAGVAQDPTGKDPARTASVVTVIDAAGKRAEQVDVLCFASPWCGDVDGVDDLVEARTDDRGRAIVRLLPGRSYTVAATKSVDKMFALSSVQSDVLVAGDTHTVRLNEGDPIEPRFLAGLDLWQAEGPLAIEVSPVKRGSFFVPMKQHAALPVERMRVLAADGGPIWQGSAEHALANGIPAPQLVKVHVKSVGGGAVAGVALWQQVPGRVRDQDWRGMPPTRGAWRMVGKTDESGAATLRVALWVVNGRVNTPLLLQARAPGQVPAQAGFDSRGVPFRGRTRSKGNRRIKVPKDHVMRFAMGQPQPLRITPPALYRVMVMGKGDHSAVGPIEEPLVVQTDGTGKASLPLRRDASCTRVALIEQDGKEPVWALLEQGARSCEVSISAATMQLSVQDRDGNPARAAAVSMIPYNEVVGFPGFRVPLRLDAAGRCTLRVNDGADWMIWSRLGDDVAWQVIPAKPSGVTDVVLKLQPMPRGKVRVRDAAGAPVVGFRMVAVGMAKWQKLATSEQFFLSFLHRELEREKIGQVTTDKAGEFWLPLLPLPGASMPLTLVSLTRGQRYAVVIRSGETAEMTVR